MAEVQVISDSLAVLDPPDDPREALLDEARGDGALVEGEEPTPEEPPVVLSEIELLRQDMQSQERALKRQISKETERRRRAALKADALEKQVQELLNERSQAGQPKAVRLSHDDEGNPVITREAIAQLTAVVATPKRPDPPNEQGRASYERMKNSLLDEDAAYGSIFTRRETVTKDIVTGLQEAAQDGESLATPDDVVEYLETSDLWSTVKQRYPELEAAEPEDFVRAISSNRAARRLAEKIRRAAAEEETPVPPTKKNGHAPTPPPPPADLTSAARARIRDKANQSVCARPTQVVDGISLDEAAKMDPEAMLALPAQTRDRIKAALRKSLSS